MGTKGERQGKRNTVLIVMHFRKCVRILIRLNDYGFFLSFLVSELIKIHEYSNTDPPSS